MGAISRPSPVSPYMTQADVNAAYWRQTAQIARKNGKEAFANFADFAANFHGSYAELTHTQQYRAIAPKLEATANFMGSPIKGTFSAVFDVIRGFVKKNNLKQSTPLVAG